MPDDSSNLTVWTNPEIISAGYCGLPTPMEGLAEGFACVLVDMVEKPTPPQLKDADLGLIRRLFAKYAAFFAKYSTNSAGSAAPDRDSEATGT